MVKSIFILSFCFVFLVSNQLFARKIQISSHRGDSKELLVRNESRSLILDYKINSFNIDESEEDYPSPYNFKKISLDQTSLTKKIGLPMVPVDQYLILGTPDSIDISVDALENIKFENIAPMPAQRPKLRCTDCNRPEFVIDVESYQKNQEMIEKRYLGDFRGKDLTQVSVKPIRITEDGGIEVTPRAQISIGSNQRYFAHFKDPSHLLLEGSLNKKMIILADSKYLSTLATFKSWKESLGYEVTIYSKQEAGNSFENIKNFINAKYQIDNFSYGIIVGTISEFPTEYVDTTSSQSTPSDLRYWTMGGANDFIPDVMYGRFVVSNVQELVNQIQKIKDYEQKKYSKEKGYLNHLGIASSEGYSPSDEEYLNMMMNRIDSAFDLDPFKFLEVNLDSTADNIVSKLSLGVHLLNYVGHGSGSSWPSINSGYFGTSTITKINPDVMKPIVIDVACQNGHFSRGKFGERWMNATNNQRPTGAVAYYGGSVNISWDPPAIMAIGINKMIASKKVKHLGEALFAGQMYLMINDSDEEGAIDNLEWFHLFGDPSMHLMLDGLNDDLDIEVPNPDNDIPEVVVTPDPIVTPNPEDNDLPDPLWESELPKFKISQGPIAIVVKDHNGKRVEGAQVTFKVSGRDIVKYTNRFGRVLAVGKFVGKSFVVKYPGFEDYRGIRKNLEDVVNSYLK